jgi:hypothetical protein
MNGPRSTHCLTCGRRLYPSESILCTKCLPADRYDQAVTIAPPRALSVPERTCEVCLKPSSFSPCVRCEESEYGPLGQRDDNW